VQYTKHLNSALDRSIESEVFFEASDWKLADICKDLTLYVAGFADSRKPGKLRERFLRSFQKPEGSLQILLGDVIGLLYQILFRRTAL
jgi:hypothetical protein